MTLRRDDYWGCTDPDPHRFDDYNIEPPPAVPRVHDVIGTVHWSREVEGWVAAAYCRTCCWLSLDFPTDSEADVAGALHAAGSA